MIRDSEQVFIKTDKDGGFVAAETSQVLMARQRVMDSNKYKVCSRRACINDNILYEYGSIGDEIGEIQGSVVTQNLVSDIVNVLGSSHSMVMDTAGICSELHMTVNAYKAQGEVVERAIHVNSKSPFKPAYRWISHEIRKVTKRPTHLLQNSKDLANKLGKTFITMGKRLITIDVNDGFYVR